MTEETTPASGTPATVIHEGLPTQLPDIDPDETGDWLASFDSMVDARGRDRARYVMLRLLERARERAIGVPALRSTDFINTIPPEREPWFPGDEDTERQVRSMIRWNAAMLVSSANSKGLEVGGHIATYQSSASLYEVGFNHFFRGKDHPGGGDQIYIQGHASPGIYARAFLEGRLTEEQLFAFRQEVQHGPHAAGKFEPAGHSLRADDAGHPLRQRVAQDAKVRPVPLGRVGLAQGLRVDGGDQRMAVVLVEAGPARDLRQGLQALGNAVQCFGVATQGARHHGIKRQSARAPVLAQAHGLLPPAGAEHVIVIRAKRGLAVAHKIEGSHGADCVARPAGRAVMRATGWRAGDRGYPAWVFRPDAGPGAGDRLR